MASESYPTDRNESLVERLDAAADWIEGVLGGQEIEVELRNEDGDKSWPANVQRKSVVEGRRVLRQLREASDELLRAYSGDGPNRPLWLIPRRR